MEPEQTTESRLRRRSLRDLLYVLFGHKGKMLVFTLLLFSMVALMTFLRPGRYRSEARLLVRLGRETVSLDPTVTIGEIAQINQSRDWEINAELEILKSREIAERVIDDLGPDVFERDFDVPTDGNAVATAEPAQGVPSTLRTIVGAVKAGPGRLAVILGLSEPLTPREQAVGRILHNMDIKALPNTNVIGLAYEEQSRGGAKAILEKFIQAYLEKHLAVYYVSDSGPFFERQVAELRTQLTQAETELREIKDTTGISSLEEQRTAMVNTIGALERSMGETEAELAGAHAKVAGIQEILARIPETVVVEQATGFADYGADLMRSRLYDLRIAEKEMAARYTPDSRMLERIREQVNEGVALLEKEQSKPMRTEVKKGLSTAYVQMQTAVLAEQANVSALESRRAEMRTQVAAAKDSLKMLNDTELRTSRLTREITLLRDSYSRYFQKLEEARIDQALKRERISSISVLQAATMPVAPVGPSRLIRLALGLLLALAGGVGFAFFCDYLDHSVKTPEDVQEKLQLPTLAYIPRTRLNTVCPVSRWSRWTRLGAARRQNVPLRWDLPVDVRRHYTAFREQLLLRANGSLPDHRVIGVTSCCRCEGVSTVAANLAASLSEHSHGAVLLVDANIQYPCIHRIFRTKQSPGLADVLSCAPEGNGEDLIVHRTAELSFVTAGRARGPLPEAVLPERFGRFLQTARQDYRFTVVDMPALEEDGAPVQLAGACDGVVLVVEAQRLRWEVILQAKQHLQQWNVNVLGVLLNKRRFPVPEWIYAAL
jgi:succinoglycan biosynthesis transport protein ExoP